MKVTLKKIPQIDHTGDKIATHFGIYYMQGTEQIMYTPDLFDTKKDAEAFCKDAGLEIE